MPLAQKSTTIEPLGKLLVKAGLVDEDAVIDALQEQKVSGSRMEDILVCRELVSRKTLDFLLENVGVTAQSEQDTTAKSWDTGANELLEDTLELPVIAVKPVLIVTVLFVIVIVLVLLSTLSMYIDFLIAGYSARQFLLDNEGNIPTLYAGLSLGFCALLLSIEYFLQSRKGSMQKFYWLGLSVIFTAFAIDELTSIHEILIALRPILNTGGLLHFAWVIPGALFVLVVVVVYWRFVFSLPHKTRNLFLLAGATYVAGVLGFEMIGGYIADNFGGDNVAYSIITTIEETLEMIGIVVFSYALLLHISSQVNSIKVKFDFKQGKELKLNQIFFNRFTSSLAANEPTGILPEPERLQR